MAPSSIPNHRMTSGMMARWGTLAQHLQAGVEGLLRGLPQAIGNAEGKSQRTADQQALQCPLRADRRMGEQLPSFKACQKARATADGAGNSLALSQP